MQLCMHVYSMCVGMFGRLLVCLHAYMHVCMCIRTWVYKYKYVCMYACMHVCMLHVSMNVCMCIYAFFHYARGCANAYVKSVRVCKHAQYARMRACVCKSTHEWNVGRPSVNMLPCHTCPRPVRANVIDGFWCLAYK